jgi:hypothetical protein
MQNVRAVLLIIRFRAYPSHFPQPQAEQDNPGDAYCTHAEPLRLLSVRY